MATEKLKKKQKIRNNEYYDTQPVFDDLYSKAKENYNFTNLLKIITSEQNILLAYRNIKKNKGSKTKGTNKNTIFDVGEKEPEKLIEYIRNRFADFRPHSIRRIEIDKGNGKMRPLGIPTIEDRIIQQCIKQVLEPICEAKFHKHSYGFRPNRSTHHAIARVLYLSNLKDFQYVVDIDIKGFFDNVNHAKLLKQMWALGIRDKNLICVISKMLKAEIKGIGVQNKGVPQGGILSPLLSNIVLNELDWWISSQWETHKTHHNYSGNHKYRAMNDTNLKEVFIVRYADDFKLFCKDRKTAHKLFLATQDWLKERLGLEISKEKSKIVNLKSHYSEFLGLKIKLWKKGSKQVVKSHLTDKAMKKCTENLKDKIKMLQKETSVPNVLAFNSTVLGLHNYYKVASHVSLDFSKIAFNVRKSLLCRTKQITSSNGKKSKAFMKFYGDYKGKVIYIHEVVMYPISKIKTSPPICISQEVCNYTSLGRNKIHDKLQTMNIDTLRYLMEHPVSERSTEYNDNRISMYVGQQGKCFVTSKKLEISEMDIHHKKPRETGGNDSYDNLVFVRTDIHKLIHATETQTIEKYINSIGFDVINFKKLNKLRILVGNCEIVGNK